MSAPEMTTYPVEAAALQPRLVPVLRVMGLLVFLVGACGIFGYGFGIEWLLTYMDTEAPQMGLPGALGLLFLGVAIKTILADVPYDKKPTWLWPVRYMSLLIPAVIGIYAIYLYLVSANFQVSSLLTQNFASIGPAFLEIFLLLLSCVSLFVVLKCHRSEGAIVYGANVFALLMFCLVAFALVGFWKNIPVLFSFKLSLPPLIAYLVTSLAILAGTLPMQGLMLPLFSDSALGRLMAVSALVMGAGILIIGAHDISQFEAFISRSLSVNSRLHPQSLYIQSEMLTIVLAILVVTLSMRMLHYFNKSAFYAREQALARQETELIKEHHRRLVEGVQDYAMIMESPEGQVMTWNIGAERIQGYTSEEILGESASCFYTPDDVRTGKPEIERHLAKTDGRFEKECICLRKDGSRFWANIVITPHYDEQGELVGFSRITRDITDRKSAEELLQKAYDDLERRVEERTLDLSIANQRLQETEQLRSTFISTLTHDLRTPLIAQKRVLEVLQSEPAIAGDSSLAELADGFRRNNDHLLHMVNMLLETYQYEDGEIKLSLEPLSLSMLIGECFAEVGSLADNQIITLENRIEPDYPQVYGDFHQLKRVFINLLGNAIENIPAQSHIRVAAAQDETYVLVEVQDNGPGISPEILPHLFDRYFTGHPTRQKIGFGLGLYICKMIVDLHGGIIKAESDVGQGTCFVVGLPKSSPE